MTLGPNAGLFINILLAVAIILALVFGYVNGFLWQIIKTILIVAIALIAFVIAPGLADVLHVLPENWSPFAGSNIPQVFYSKINTVLCFILIFLIGMIIVLICKPIFKAVTELKVVSWIDHIGGMILSLIPVCVFIVLLTYVLSTAIFTNGKDIINSCVLKYTQPVTEQISSILSDTLGENIALQKLINDPLSLEQQDLEKIVDWLKNAQISGEEISSFLQQYGIDVNKINELINQGE